MRFIIKIFYYFFYYLSKIYFYYTDLFLPKVQFIRKCYLLNGQTISEHKYLNKFVICSYNNDPIDVEEFERNKNFLLNATLLYHGNTLGELKEYDITTTIKRFSMYFKGGIFKWSDVLEYILHVHDLDTFNFDKTADLIFYKNDLNFTDITIQIKDVYDKEFSIDELFV